MSLFCGTEGPPLSRCKRVLCVLLCCTIPLPGSPVALQHWTQQVGWTLTRYDWCPFKRKSGPRHIYRENATWTWRRPSINPGEELGTAPSFIALRSNTVNILNFILFYFLLFRANPVTYGSSQARGWIGATAASLYHSHSNTGSEPYLRPTPQLMATLGP